MSEKFKSAMSDYIPNAVLVLIFTHLPVKTLLRYRSLCKGWKELIDSPTFAQDHLSVQKPRFIVEYGRGRKYFIVDPPSRPLVSTLNKPIPRAHFYLIGTLHGVVCLFDYAKILLWNPSIHKSLSVRLPSDFRWYFDEWYSGGQYQTCYGFWIDPTSKEFKIVILQRKPVVNCILYSSIQRDWSVIPTRELANWSTCKEGPPVMIGCVAHWGGCLEEYNGVYHVDHGHEDKLILSFDFVQESFEVIEFPDFAQYRTRRLPSMMHYNFAPFRWQGTLSLLCWNAECPCTCKIFLRKEDSWVGMFAFECNSSIEHVFWAMEDIEEGKKKGKRKREREESHRNSIGETQDNVRLLATVKWEPVKWTGGLLLQGTKSGYKYVKRGLEEYYKVNMAYDFVESLLFP